MKDIPFGTRVAIGLLQATGNVMHCMLWGPKTQVSAAVRSAGFGTVMLSVLAPAVKCAFGCPSHRY